MAAHPEAGTSLTCLDEHFTTKAAASSNEARGSAAVMAASRAAGSSTGDDAILLIASQVEAHASPASWVQVHVEGASKLACSHFHILAAGHAGMYSWGRGLLGVLGNGTEVDEDLPRIDSMDDTSPHVSCGPYHSACTTLDGKLFCGGGCHGTTKDGRLDETLTTLLANASRRCCTGKGVACGCFATAAGSNGQLYTWGRGGVGSWVTHVR